MALVSGGKLPTVTRLCAKHHWLAAAAVIGLTTHLAVYWHGFPSEVLA